MSLRPRNETTYLADVFLHPLQELPLIQEASIQRTVLANLGAGQEAEDADAVVEVDKDDVAAALLDHLGPVEVAIIVAGVAAALDKEPDWELGRGGGIGGLEDVDKEAVFIKRIARANTGPDAESTKLGDGLAKEN